MTTQIAAIDADAHVVESEATWDYLDPGDLKYRPTLTPSQGEGTRQYWIIDGQVRGLARPVLTAHSMQQFSTNAGRNAITPQEAREVENVDTRLRHMDELGVDVQVLHSTIFIAQIADRPEVEIPLCRAWNRWMGDIWQAAKGRLRYSCVLPFLSIADALDELRFAKQHGAVAIFTRPIEGKRLLHDPYFFPVWEEASRLNIPIVVHVGNANPYVNHLLSQYAAMSSGVWPLSVQTIGAFHAWAMNGMPDRFPQLRFGVVECTASWLPYVVNDWKRRFHTFGKPVGEYPMRDYRMYVDLQSDDDIAYLVQQCGEDNLMIGTDYGHNDNSSEIEALRRVQERGDIDPRIINKILSDNPKAFYGM